MTVEQLKGRAKAYFDKGVKEIYATEDGNFFYTEHKSFALAHSKQQKTKLHLLGPKGEVEEKKVEKPTAPKNVATMQGKQTKKVE